MLTLEKMYEASMSQSSKRHHPTTEVMCSSTLYILYIFKYFQILTELIPAELDVHIVLTNARPATLLRNCVCLKFQENR